MSTSGYLNFKKFTKGNKNSTYVIGCQVDKQAHSCKVLGNLFIEFYEKGTFLKAL